MSTSMTATEHRAALSLAAIYALRMLGLFMILPVFALYATGHLSGATPFLIGLAIGIYGLTNALLQIPLGWLSDRVGRKKVIIFGLLLFAVGSVVAAQSSSIYGVILGRALQGAGAIAAAVMALAADLTHEDHRLRVMAIIGMTIGLSFSVALVLGPLLDGWIGVPGIFWLTAALALSAIVVVKFWVPDPLVSRFHRDAEVTPGQFWDVFKDRQLLLLNFGIFVLHMLLTASFVVTPVALHDVAGLEQSRHWMVYLGVQIVAMGAMIPFVILAEKRRKMKQIFIAAIAMLVVAELWLGMLHRHTVSIVIMLQLFFLAFNILEATLPSLVAKTAPPDRKGTAMGAYATAQFLGAFSGGALGGWLHGEAGISVVFFACAGMATVWLIIASTRMQEPRYLSNHVLALGAAALERRDELHAALARVRGVAEVVLHLEEGMAYLKVDLQQLDRAALQAFSPAAAT